VTAAIMMVSAIIAGHNTQVSVWWQILAFALITYAELCISMVGLEFAYEQALPGTKSFVTAVFFLTIFVGDSLGALVVDYYDHPLSPAVYFGLQIVLMVVCTVIFWFVAKRFESSAPVEHPAAVAQTAV